MTIDPPLFPSTPADSERQHSQHTVARSTAVLGTMLVAIVAVIALAFWDDQRESAAALEDFGAEQSAVAAAAAAALLTQFAAIEQQARVNASCCARM